ncbi:MAG: hypothetical protein WAM42_01970 [Candidatus Nitrosopolaris sp.]
MILNYIIHLKKIAKQSAGKPKTGELSVNSIKHYLKGIKSFLEFNEIALPWNKIAKFLPDDVTNSYRSYTKEAFIMAPKSMDHSVHLPVLVSAIFKISPYLGKVYS